MASPKPTGRDLDGTYADQLRLCPWCQRRSGLLFSGSKLGVFIECMYCWVRGPMAQNWAWAKRKWNDR